MRARGKLLSSGKTNETRSREPRVQTRPTCRAVLKKLKSLANPRNVTGRARYGINTERAYGISVYQLDKIAREIGADHALAQELWSSGIHEARLLASFVDSPEMISEEQMEAWVRDFDSWYLCDQCCSKLFDRTKCAYRKAFAWSKRPETFVKRAGFVLMAAPAVHDKKAPDGKFIKFLPVIRREATDERNFVKKAVNWALRQIGKRNSELNTAAFKNAEQIRQLGSPSARWIAADALRELTSPEVRKRLRT